MEEEFEKCNSKEDADELLDSLERKIKADSGKFIEELKEDAKRAKDEILENSTLTKRTIVIEKSKVDKQLEDDIISEGRHTAKQLEKVNKEHEYTCES